MVRDRSLAVGTLSALTGFLLWGFLPFYWKGLDGVPALEILGHRIAWSALILIIVVPLTQWEALRPALASPRSILLAAGAGVLVGINWLVYTYAVGVDRLVEASLGYYINPLVSVALGVLVLKERLTRVQVVALVLAIIGVVVLTVPVGRFPWISVTVAFSFGLYGLIKKTNAIGSFVSLFIELLVLAPAALVYLVLLQSRGSSAFLDGNAGTTLLLIGAGLATLTPLFFFGAGARRIPLARLGFLQYLAPTIMLVIGIVAYGEPFTWMHLTSFLFIWTALGFYTVAILRGARADRRTTDQGRKNV
jgi:chloramphenicol-sensitive protein RarD